MGPRSLIGSANRRENKFTSMPAPLGLSTIRETHEKELDIRIALLSVSESVLNKAATNSK